MSVARPRAHHAKPVAISPWSRVYGMGSVYAKTLRDSRIAIIVLAAILGLMLLATGADYGQAYATTQSRADFVNVIHELPTAVRGIYGDPFPANLSTLGGMVSLKIAASAALVACFWSILALSSTLASEARRGSLELMAVTPLGRRKLALEKLAAHVTSLAIVLAVLAAACWLSGAAFGSLPGDSISAQASLGFAVWIGLIALASGSIAFALAPLFGRAGAAGIAGALTVGGFLVNGYQSAVPAFSGWSNVTWFGWTVHNQPLAGQYDWPSLIPVALLALVFLALGVEIFARRDLGATTSIPWLRFPQATLGLGGPLGRSFGDRLPLALAWGTGLGLFGMVMGASAGSFSDSIGKTSQTSLDLFHRLFPGIDLTTAGGFLQLTFVEFGFIFAGFAAVTLIAGWASDELRGRFELLLTAPLSRVKWAVSSGLGVHGRPRGDDGGDGAWDWRRCSHGGERRRDADAWHGGAGSLRGGHRGSGAGARLPDPPFHRGGHVGRAGEPDLPVRPGRAWSEAARLGASAGAHVASWPADGGRVELVRRCPVSAAGIRRAGTLRLGPEPERPGAR